MLNKSYRVEGGVVAHVIIVSALGPNPSFFLFLGDFYSTWGPVGTGARTWTGLDNNISAP